MELDEKATDLEQLAEVNGAMGAADFATAAGGMVLGLFVLGCVCILICRK